MTYELRQKLLRMERKLPKVHVYDWNDYFPKGIVVLWTSRLVDKSINFFFLFMIALVLITEFMMLGPSWLLAEALVEPMCDMWAPTMDLPPAEVEALMRIAIKKDIFALGR